MPHGDIFMDSVEKVSCPQQDRETLLAAYAAGERDFQGWQLAECDLTGCNLSGASFVGADLNGALLNRCDLTRADFSRAHMARANLSESDLGWAKLSEAELIGADLRRIKARAANFSSALLLRARMNEADCLGAMMSGINATAAQLESANLECTDLSNASLVNANMSGTNCSWANLSDARLNWAIMSWSLLEAADLENANLTGTVLHSSNLSFANLNDAILTGADLYFATLSGALLPKDVPTARLVSSRLTSQTYSRSQWTRHVLREWQQKGAILLDFESFPKDVQAYIREGECSLRIYFTIPVEREERLAIETYIYHLVQSESKLRMLSISNEKGRGYVAFYAPDNAAVEQFVSALRSRAWQNDPGAIEREFYDYQTPARRIDIDIIQVLDDLASHIYHIQTPFPLQHEESDKPHRAVSSENRELQPGISWTSVTMPKVQR